MVLRHVDHRKSDPNLTGRFRLQIVSFALVLKNKKYVFDENTERYDRRAICKRWEGRFRKHPRLETTTTSPGRVLTLLGQMSGENQPETRVALHRRCRGDVNVQRLTVYTGACRQNACRLRVAATTIARWRTGAFCEGKGRNGENPTWPYTSVGHPEMFRRETPRETKARERERERRPGRFFILFFRFFVSTNPFCSVSSPFGRTGFSRYGAPEFPVSKTVPQGPRPAENGHVAFKNQTSRVFSLSAVVSPVKRSRIVFFWKSCFQGFWKNSIFIVA